MTATKTALKSNYIARLQAAYPFYTEGSRPLELANLAADKALSGTMRLEGECWFAALKDHGLNKRTTLTQLAALPA